MTLASTLATLVATWEAAGVLLDVDHTPDQLFLMDFQRHPDAPAGSGKEALTALLALATTHHLPVALCCSSTNSTLLAYYATLGFQDKGPVEEDPTFRWLQTPDG